VKDLPLRGLRLLVTRRSAQATTLCDLIRAVGGEPILIPAIEIAPAPDSSALDRALGDLDAYDWLVFTSANAVRAFHARAEALEASGSPGGGWRQAPASRPVETAGPAAAGPAAAGPAAPPTRPRIAAIGPATARAWLEYSSGLGAARSGPAEAIAMPEDFVSEALAERLGAVAGMRILIPGSDISRKGLGEALRARGARVDEIAAYVTAPAAASAEALRELARGFDAVLFASPSAARGFAAMTGGPEGLGGTLVACIGPVTAEEARRLGYAVGLVAEVHSAEGLVDALVRHYGNAAAAGRNDGKERSL